MNFFYKFSLISVIPQTCKYRSKKYECGLSISCILGGGKPMDLCSGGMIWSCCVDVAPAQQDDPPQQSGSLQNSSEWYRHLKSTLMLPSHTLQRRNWGKWYVRAMWVSQATNNWEKSKKENPFKRPNDRAQTLIIILLDVFLVANRMQFHV